MFYAGQYGYAVYSRASLTQGQAIYSGGAITAGRSSTSTATFPDEGVYGWHLIVSQYWQTPDTQWHAKVYVDGDLVGDEVDVGAENNGYLAYIGIGGAFTGGPWFLSDAFVGDIADVCIWHELLTAAEAEDLWLGVLPTEIRPTVLSARWLLPETGELTNTGTGSLAHLFGTLTNSGSVVSPDPEWPGNPPNKNAVIHSPDTFSEFAATDPDAPLRDNLAFWHPLTPPFTDEYAAWNGRTGHGPLTEDVGNKLLVGDDNSYRALPEASQSIKSDMQPFGFGGHTYSCWLKVHSFYSPGHGDMLLPAMILASYPEGGQWTVLGYLTDHSIPWGLQRRLTYCRQNSYPFHGGAETPFTIPQGVWFHLIMTVLPDNQGGGGAYSSIHWYTDGNFRHHGIGNYSATILPYSSTEVHVSNLPLLGQPWGDHSLKDLRIYRGPVDAVQARTIYEHSLAFHLATADAGLVNTATRPVRVPAAPPDPAQVPDLYAPNEDLSWVQKATHIWALHPNDPTKADKGGLTLELAGTGTLPTVVEPDNTLQFYGGNEQGARYYRTIGTLVFGDDPLTAGNQTPPAIGGVSCWVKQDALTQFMGLVGDASNSDVGVHVLSQNAGFILGTIGDMSFPGLTITTGEWFHVALQNDATYRRLYLNGVKVSEDAQATTVPVPATQFWLAHDSWGQGANQNALIGQIRLVAIIQGANWTDAEVLEQYERPYGYYIEVEAPPPVVFTADGGAFACAGQDAVLRVGRVVTSDVGAFAVEGNEVPLTFVGADFASIGSIGSINSKASNQSTLVLTTTSTAEAGNAVVVVVAKDNTQTTNATSNQITLADSAGNTWTKLGEHTYSGGAAQDGTTVAMFISQLANQLTSGGTITATLGGTTNSNDASAMTTWEFSVAAGKVVATPTATSAGFASATTNMTHTLSGLPSKNYLWLHGVGLEWNSATAYGPPTDYTEIPEAFTVGSTQATNQVAGGAFRIFTGTSQTITVPVTTIDKAGIFAAIATVPAPVKLIADVRAFTLAGQPAQTIRTVIMPATPAGAFVFAGQNAAIGRILRLTADSGGFGLAGLDAGLRYLRGIAADIGVFSLAGQDALLTPSGAPAKLPGDVGTFGLVGVDAGLFVGRVVQSAIGPFAVAGQDAAVRVGRAMISDAGVFALAGMDALFYVNRLLVSATGAFSLAGQDAAFIALIPKRVAAELGAFALDGQSAGVLYKRIFPASVGTFGFTGAPVLLPLGRAMAALGAGFSLAGQSALSALTRRLTVESGALLLSGQDAVLRTTRQLVSTLGAFSYAGQVVPLRVGRGLVSDPAEFLFHGKDAVLARLQLLLAESGSFVLAGQDAQLPTYLVLSGSGRIFYIHWDDRVYEIASTEDNRVYHIPSDRNIHDL